VSREAFHQLSSVVEIGQRRLSAKDRAKWRQTYDAAHTAAWTEAEALPEDEQERRFAALYQLAASAPLERTQSPAFRALTPRMQQQAAEDYYKRLTE
jgi:hypothetical protein